MKTCKMLWPVAALLISAAAASAHQGATGIVKERMDLMTELASAMKLVAATVRAAEAWNPGPVAEAAARIGAHARTLPEMFPRHERSAVSAARPEIWENEERFVSLFRDLETHATALETAAKSDDRAAAAAAFREAGRACSACHKEFRVPDKR